MYGKTHSEAVRKKISEANKGKTLSKEHIQKLIQANTGRKKTPKEIEKLRQANLGKKISEEAKQKMLNKLCPFEYHIFFNEELKQICLGRTALQKYCKENFNISKTIIEQILQGTWRPTFNKHKWLKTLKIIKIERCID